MKLQNENSSSAGLKPVSELEPEAMASVSEMFLLNMETGKVIKENFSTNDAENLKQQKQQAQPNEMEPSTRLLRITKTESNECGFHLTRTKWDPYPWVSAVVADTPADISGLKAGDCVLEVNGEDVLGRRITDIAKLVKAESEHVTLLLWNAGCNVKSEPESLCDGPMPATLQRLSVIVQSILSIIECPVCLDTIPPPAMQCQNGHLLCVNCRIRAEKCPVCRDCYTPRRALIAEQIYAAITNAFNLCRSEDKLRQKLFGTNVQQQQQQQQQTESMPHMVAASTDKETCQKAPKPVLTPTNRASRSDAQVCKSKTNRSKERFGVTLPTANKFLTKLLHGKACSMDNLSSAMTATATATTTVAATTTNCEPTTATTMKMANATGDVGGGGGDHLSMPSTSSLLLVTNSETVLPLNVMTGSSRGNNNKNNTNETIKATQPMQSCSNQLQHIMAAPPNAKKCRTATNTTTTTTATATATENLDAFEAKTKNNVAQVNGMSKRFSLSTCDLLAQQKQRRKTSQQSAIQSPAFDVSIIERRMTLQPPLKSSTYCVSPRCHCCCCCYCSRSRIISNSSHRQQNCSDSLESIRSDTSTGDNISIASSFTQIALSTAATTALSCCTPPSQRFTSETSSPLLSSAASTSSSSSSSSLSLSTSHSDSSASHQR